MTTKISLQFGNILLQGHSVMALEINTTQGQGFH